MTGFCWVASFLFLFMIFGATRSPTRILSVYAGLGALWLSLVAGILVFDIRPSSTIKQEAIPSSVRENPASYRPVLILYSGYHSRYSTGGYGGGK